MLVDTSVWVDHLRRGNAALVRLLNRDEVRTHPFVIGELACGNLRSRKEILALLAALPQAAVAGHRETLAFVEANRLMGRGIGWVDVHLLASARLTGIPLWTLDRRLKEIAGSLGLVPAPAEGAA
jgi:predicted nucleic acid-binding protein